jgi:hypothetical protein
MSSRAKTKLIQSTAFFPLLVTLSFKINCSKQKERKKERKFIIPFQMLVKEKSSPLEVEVLTWRIKKMNWLTQASCVDIPG